MPSTNFKATCIAFLARIQANTQPGTEAHYLLSEYMDEMLSSRVTLTLAKPLPCSPVPVYNSANDGHYEDWLILNNID